MWGWKEIGGKAREVRKLIQNTMRLPFEILMGVTPVYTRFP
jgi:hypothetical protein